MSESSFQLMAINEINVPLCHCTTNIPGAEVQSFYFLPNMVGGRLLTGYPLNREQWTTCNNYLFSELSLLYFTLDNLTEQLKSNPVTSQASVTKLSNTQYCCYRGQGHRALNRIRREWNLLSVRWIKRSRQGIPARKSWSQCYRRRSHRQAMIYHPLQCALRLCGSRCCPHVEKLTRMILRNAEKLHDRHLTRN